MSSVNALPKHEINCNGRQFTFVQTAKRLLPSVTVGSVLGSIKHHAENKNHTKYYTKPLAPMNYDFSSSNPASRLIYKVLSYVWGSPIAKPAIVVHVVDVAATTNLFSALGLLRKNGLAQAFSVGEVIAQLGKIGDASDYGTALFFLWGKALVEQGLEWFRNQHDASGFLSSIQDPSEPKIAMGFSGIFVMKKVVGIMCGLRNLPGSNLIANTFFFYIGDIFEDAKLEDSYDVSKKISLVDATSSRSFIFIPNDPRNHVLALLGFSRLSARLSIVVDYSVLTFVRVGYSDRLESSISTVSEKVAGRLHSSSANDQPEIKLRGITVSIISQALDGSTDWDTPLDPRWKILLLTSNSILGFQYQYFNNTYLSLQAYFRTPLATQTAAAEASADSTTPLYILYLSDTDKETLMAEL
ncbi:uncharacterized protein BDR25DRAFT_349227 [Lindgomyces ingoldianus]|uniref:Uncharacterized protein n=1 Tax=Lindgomyces ingoldianus TaxID=673940 RepID=A0ACB6RFL7_9PLEO|nr:uncharacterized protein BDR25DRAFT_349227 [Lindgomyces ingoldianus]KAF2477282.1 hypothetical protein BDR25DRAFT_349227 [Lindgomyces ingoldianus]